MRWSVFISLQCLLLIIAGTLVYLHKDSVSLIKTPPDSLAQWYKPHNKRQVWLHTMFKLRREMQAIRFYAERGDSVHLEKWSAELQKDYLKIAEMVPEWQQKLDLDAIDQLQAVAVSQRYEEVPTAIDKLAESCQSCHTDYQTVTAAIYRAPDFSSLEVEQSEPFKDHMKKLTQQVNQIKIASKDGMQAFALETLAELQTSMAALGETCSTCHKKDSRTYPDEGMQKTMHRLKESLATGTLKEQGRELGTLAVIACARCHGTHRFASGARDLFVEERNWMELIKH